MKGSDVEDYGSGTPDLKDVLLNPCVCKSSLHCRGLIVIGVPHVAGTGVGT